MRPTDPTSSLAPTTDRPDESEGLAIARPSWLPPEQWPFALRRYDHPMPDGRRLAIHYTDEGTGPPLVLVHAGLWSFVWRDLIAQLRHRFRCVTLDLPGSGLSAGTARDVDLRTFTDVLDGLLDHRSVEGATMVVHDLGGVVGIVSAGRRPERVTGIVAVNSFAWPPDGLALRAMLGLMGSRSMTWTLGSARTIPRLSATGLGIGRHLDRDGRRAFRGAYRRRPAARSFHRAMRSARRSQALFAEADQALITSLADRPVLTVFGERNDPFGFADRWRERFPHASSWVVEGGNHFPMCDDPVGLAERVAAWYDATAG